MKPNVLDWIAMCLVVIGGLNWGLVGLFSFNLVETIFGSFSPITRIIYILVGVAAVVMIIGSRKMKGEGVSSAPMTK